MSYRDSINQSLAALDAPTGVALTLDDTGAVGISLASGLVLTIEVEEDNAMLHLHTSLRRLSAGNGRHALLEDALALNLLTRATGGATIGLDRRSDTLVLSVSKDIPALTHEDFAALLADFAETAQDVQTRLGGQDAAAPETAPAFAADHADPRFLA